MLKSSDAATAEEKERLRLAIATGGILLALAAAAVMLRLHRLGEAPPGILADEASNGVDALQVLQGEHAIYFPPRSHKGSDGRVGLVVYAVAPFVAAFGNNMLALRLPTALAGAATVLVVFWLGRVLFGRDGPGRSTAWRGTAIGGAGAGLLAVSLGQTIIGRTALRAGYLPLFLSLCLILLWLGWKERNLWKVALAGLLAGLLHYTYIAARVTPILFLVLGLTSLTALHRTELAEAKGWSRLHVLRAALRQDLPLIAAFAGALTLVAAPIAAYFALHPQDFSGRIDQLLLVGDGPLPILAAFLENAWDHMLAFGFHGDPYWRRNFDGRPLLSAWEAAFFWSGVGISLWRWKECAACRLLLLWFGVLMLPAFLARDQAPHTVRMIGAAPATFLLLSFGMWEVLRSLWARLRALPWRPWPTFQLSGQKAASAAGILLCVAILAKGALTYRTYFQEWASAPQLHSEFEVEWSHLAELLNARPSDSETVYLVPDGQRLQSLPESYQSFIWDYLTRSAAPAHLLHSAVPDLAHQVESVLRAAEDPTQVNVVDWNQEYIWTGDEDERFAFLLGKYARYQGSVRYETFYVHSYRDVDLEESWRFYDYLQPLEIQYDGGIALDGFALGQAGRQIPAGENVDVERSLPMFVALAWETGPELSIDYALSLRLYDAGENRFALRDSVLWKPDHNFTGSGGPSAQFDSLVQFELPSDLPAGEYELRLVVYDRVSLKPTVVLGVWEPEVVLARLRVATGPAPGTDPRGPQTGPLLSLNGQ